MTESTWSALTGDTPSGHPPRLHRLIMAGQLRYWVIASWGFALTTVIPWTLALGWFAAATLLGLIRTLIERPSVLKCGDAEFDGPKLIVATVSCAAWAVAPWLAYTSGQTYGPAIAVGLLMAGYTLIFTQMRAATKEALIVSLPYSLVMTLLLWDLWEAHKSVAVLCLVPVLGLPLLIKVVITQIRDAQFSAVNERQAKLIVGLAAARDRADVANQAKSNFLAVMSHELRTPLNGVLGAAQLLAQAQLVPSHQNYVAIIKQSGEDLLSLLNDILDLTKVGADRVELAPTEVDTTDLMPRLIGPFGVQARAKGLVFWEEVRGDIPKRIRVDSLRLAQVIHNLLGNAVKFTDAGSIGLFVESVKVAEDRVRLTFNIVDTGTGIEEKHLGEMFQPFTQVDVSATRRFGGAGLGLSICQRLVELMKGRITVASTYGQGSIFAFSIEVGACGWGGEAVFAQSPRRRDELRRPLNVLVAMDHPINRMVLKAWMETIGHECILTDDGEDALRCAQKEKFDLILMDVAMPTLDGRSATRLIRADPGPNLQTPIVLVYPSIASYAKRAWPDVGADAHLACPLNLDVMKTLFEGCRAGRRSIRNLGLRPAQEVDRSGSVQAHSLR